jgi:hypothetical protein
MQKGRKNMFRAKFYWAIHTAVLTLIILTVATPSSTLETNYGSIGTNTNVLYSTGSAWILASTTTRDFYSGAGLPAYIRKEDKLVIDDEEFYILAVNPAFIHTDDMDGIEGKDRSQWDIGADEYRVCSSGIWYVDSEKYGDGTSWDTAFETIRQAVSAAGPGEEIWVKQGTYLLSSEIKIDKSVSIYGCFEGTETQRTQRDCGVNETVVDGQKSYRCFGIDASDVIIDGFTIQNGDHDFGGGMYASDSSSFTVSNCTFKLNHANDGGGFLNEAPQGELINCIFQDNTAVDNGGGIYILGPSLNVTNCIFSGNEAGDTYGPAGGAIFNTHSNPNITNCTFSGNIARDNSEG